MDARWSAKIYPRRDTVYKSKKSLNYDLVKTKIFRERPKTKCLVFVDWIPYWIVGILVGFTASIMSYIEEGTTDWKKRTVNGLIDGESNEVGKGWAFYTFFSMLLVLLSSTMTVYWGPGANGSGVAELIGYLNGINYPGTFGFNTFTTKVFGVVLAVVGGLCVGKEGPLAHIGGNLGLASLYLPIPGFEYFRNDTNKRFLIAAGTSAGVSAAFGAPIGGALFAYECSKPNTFWKFSVIWKVFFSCATAVFSFALFNAMARGQNALTVTSAVLKFGDIDI